MIFAKRQNIYRIKRINTETLSIDCERYEMLTEKCRPFLRGLEHFPDVVQRFIEHISSLFNEKEQEQKRRLPKARNEHDR
jgi:hypothetical protein